MVRPELQLVTLHAGDRVAIAFRASDLEELLPGEDSVGFLRVLCLQLRRTLRNGNFGYQLRVGLWGFL
jgi:hypothetical protein